MGLLATEFFTTRTPDPSKPTVRHIMSCTGSIPHKGDKRRVRQAAHRGSYEQDVLYGILDAASIGHVAFIKDEWPQSIPMAIARMGDYLYLHGSRSSRLMKFLADGGRVCVSICLVDGLVKARSAFHCSMNFRSAVVFGSGESVTTDDKFDLLDQFTEQLIPGTKNDFRPGLAKEYKATELIRIPLTEASAKVRSGDPIDDEEDLDLPYWSGVIPVQTVLGDPVPAADLKESIQPSDAMLAALKPV